MIRRYIKWFKQDRLDGFMVSVLFVIMVIAILMMLGGLAVGFYELIHGGSGNYE